MSSWQVIFLKELKDVTRDRRTLIFMLLLPTFSIPLVLWITTSLMTHFARKLAREEAPVLFLNPDASPRLVQAVVEKGGLPRKATALEGVLQQLGLSSKELALVSKDPQAFLALLRRKNISPEKLKASLSRIDDMDEIDPSPSALLEMLQIPNVRILTRPPEGLEQLPGLEAGALQSALAEAIRKRKLSAAIYLEPETEHLLQSEQAAKVVIYYLETNDRSLAALRGLQRILRAVSQTITAERIERRALPATFATPLKVKPERLPGPGILIKLLSQLLPYMILIFSMLGALYPAIDVGAGEKERGTMETLLSSPVGRTELVLGKFLVVVVAALIAAVLATVSLAVSLSLGVFSEIQLISESAFSFKADQAALALLMILPMAAIFSALLLAISVFARSFKEAQSYSSPLQIMLILPAFASFIPGVELDWVTSSIPVVNVSLALKEIFTGNTDQHLGHLLLIFFSSALLAALLIAFSVWWFRQEKVLFRQ